MLICDFAETYGILDYHTITPFQAATLAYGLRADSRIRIKEKGMDASMRDILLVRAVDELAFIRWLNTVDGQRGVNRPIPLAEKLIGQKNESATKYGRDTPEEFMRDYYGK